MVYTKQKAMISMTYYTKDRRKLAVLRHIPYSFQFVISKHTFPAFITPFIYQVIHIMVMGSKINKLNIGF